MFSRGFKQGCATFVIVWFGIICADDDEPDLNAKQIEVRRIQCEDRQPESTRRPSHKYTEQDAISWKWVQRTWLCTSWCLSKYNYNENLLCFILQLLDCVHVVHMLVEVGTHEVPSSPLNSCCIHEPQKTSASCLVSSQPHNTVPHNVHTYSSAQRHNKSPSKSSHSSILQLSLISFSADEGTDCSRACREMADGVVCFQSELFHNFQSAVAEVESLSCRLSEQLVKCLLSRVHTSFGGAAQSMSFKWLETEVDLFTWKCLWWRMKWGEWSFGWDFNE